MMYESISTTTLLSTGLTIDDGRWTIRAHRPSSIVYRHVYNHIGSLYMKMATSYRLFSPSLVIVTIPASPSTTIGCPLLRRSVATPVPRTAGI